MLPRPTDRRGFTLRDPWALLALVILLALAAFFLFRRIGTDTRLRATVLHSLAILADSQAAYHRRHGVYAARIADAPAEGAVGVHPDAGVVLTMVLADSLWWSARGSHHAIAWAPRACSAYGGAPRDPALRHPNHPTCP